MSEPIEVTDETFEREVLSAGRPVLVDFWAEWCAPCHIVAREVESIAAEEPGGLKVAKLDIDANPATAERYDVMSIPTLVLFVGGRERTRLVGARPRSAILAHFGPHLPAQASA